MGATFLGVKLEGQGGSEENFCCKRGLGWRGVVESFVASFVESAAEREFELWRMYPEVLCEEFVLFSK